MVVAEGVENSMHDEADDFLTNSDAMAARILSRDRGRDVNIGDERFPGRAREAE
jgi:hypothetical protein